MKKLICSVLCVLLFINSFCGVLAANYETCTIYAPDGRMATIDRSQLENYKSVGWYDYPVALLYAPDGRSIVVAKSDVPAWEAVGWADAKKNITIYAPDGRSAVIPYWQLGSYKAVGWYDYPVITLYASGNRTAVVAKSAQYDWLSVGWSRTPVVDKTTFLKNVEGWWVNLDSCETYQYFSGISLEYLYFSGSDIEAGATYSEYTRMKFRNLTHISDTRYTASIYTPGYWYGDMYFESYNIEWNLNYAGGNTMTISGSGLSYTYTYIGKGYNYDSIQHHPLVVDAAK